MMLWQASTRLKLHKRTANDRCPFVCFAFAVFCRKNSRYFPCKVNVINKGKKVNGKSSLSMLTLGIAANEEVTLEIDGEQELQALNALGKLLTDFHE